MSIDFAHKYTVLSESRDGQLLTLVRKLVLQPVEPQTRMNTDEPVFGSCIEYGTHEECVNKQVCHIVAVGGGAAIGDVPGAVIGEGVSQTVCEWIPACSNVRVCTKWL